MNSGKIYAKMLAAEYAPKNDRKVIALRKLDKKAKRPAVVFAYTLGTIATLVFSMGLYSLVLSCSPAGVILIFVGLSGMVANCPLYDKILNICTRRYAFEIVELAKEICGCDEFKDNI